MAILDDLLTAAKNIVTAINGIGTTYQKIGGNQTSPVASSAYQVFTGQGRAVRVSVTTAGSADAMIYDSSSISALSKPIAYVHKDANVVEIGIPVINGIVVVPGTGQSIVVVYSKE